MDSDHESLGIRNEEEENDDDDEVCDALDFNYFNDRELMA